MADIIFIYAEADAGRVREICAALGKAGLACDPDRSIPPGATYAAHMAERLVAAKAVVMCWSGASVGDARLTDEAAAARDAGKLAPLTLDGTPPPLGFRQIQTASLADWPGAGAKSALDALAAALTGLRDGAAPGRARRVGRGARRPFVRSWKFWILSAATAAGIGALLFLSPEGRAEMQRGGEGLAGRLETLAVFAAMAFLFTPASRALLHGSRRLIGLDSRAFFSAEYLAVLIVSVATAGAVHLYRQHIGGGAPGQDFSLLTTLGAGATVFPLLLAGLILILRALRRVILGRAEAP